MTYSEALERLKALCERLSYLKAVDALFMWDQIKSLPREGAPYRGRLQGFISGESSRCLHSSDAEALFRYFSDVPLDSVENIYERGMIRDFMTRYRNTCNVPDSIAEEISVLSMQSQDAWIQARAAGDFNILKPYMAKMLELQKQVALKIDPDRPPFETLVESTDEGLSITDIDREFDKIKLAITDLLKKISNSGANIDDSFLKKDFDKGRLMSFAKLVAEGMGYNPARGGYAEAPHPFTNTYGPKDARITFNMESYALGVFGTIHEAGHGMYGYGGNEQTDSHHLWGGIMGGFHEAQSRFFENILGKSLANWEHFYPLAQQYFPQFSGVSLMEYYRAINKVTPSLKRIVADEVTYSLHPIIRYELERELFSGNLLIDDLPQAWNEKYDRYLSIRPSNDTEGVLQDIHWPAGSFGYFQSYTVGNVYGGQLYQALLRDVPQAMAEISRGNFAPANQWLDQNIRQFGRCIPARDLMISLTGKPFDADPFIKYLNDKYSEIYGFAL